MVSLGIVIFPIPDWLEFETKSIIRCLSPLSIIFSPLLAIGHDYILTKCIPAPEINSTLVLENTKHQTHQ